MSQGSAFCIQEELLNKQTASLCDAALYLLACLTSLLTIDLGCNPHFLLDAGMLLLYDMLTYPGRVYAALHIFSLVTHRTFAWLWSQYVAVVFL